MDGANKKERKKERFDKTKGSERMKSSNKYVPTRLLAFELAAHVQYTRAHTQTSNT